MNSTIEYYNQHAKEFHERTIDLDVSNNCLKFISHLPECGHILDAGCGTGRDALFFLNRHYRVSAFDASLEMVKLARSTTGIDVKHHTFLDFVDQDYYDGIWANASLLHVSHYELPNIFKKFHLALNNNGILYASFKYGFGCDKKTDREFWYIDEHTLQTYMKDLFKVIELWINDNNRKNKPQWLNLIARKKA